MKLQTTVIILLILIVSNLAALNFLNVSVAIKQNKISTCSPITRLEKCNRNFENTTQWIWRRDKQYIIRSVTKKECESSTLSHTWTLAKGRGRKQTMHKFKDKSEFLLDYYDLDTGSYTLTVTVTEKSDRGSAEAGDKCLINIRPELPVAVILGGNVRIVPSGASFLVDGKYSINFDVRPDLPATLHYKWSCVCRTSPNYKFCKPTEISYANEVEFPPARDGDQFTVYLSVATDNSDWVQTQQDINVVDGGHNIVIDCIKNCRVVVNYLSQVYLEAICDDCSSQSFTWSMVPGKNNVKKEINFNSDTVYGPSTTKLVVKRGVLIPGDEYQFYCYYKDQKSYAYETLNVSILPQMSGECTITPKKGQSLVTLFTIVCEGVVHTQPVSVTLYQTGETDTLLATNHTGRFDVHLPAGNGAVKLYVKISDPDNLFIIKNLTAEVTSFTSEASDKLKALTDKYDEIVPQALKTESTEKAMRLINTMSAEAKLVSGDDKQMKKLKKKIIQEIEAIPLVTEADVAQASGINKNVWSVKTELDREFAKVSLHLSEKIAREHLNIINKAPFPDALDLDVNEVIPNLLWVANRGLEAFESEKIVHDVTFDITTPAEVVTVPFVTEYYDDYKDTDLDYASRMRDYKATTKSAIDTLTLTCLAVAKTLIPGEPSVNVSEKPNVQVLTGTPSDHANTKLGLADAYVVGSPSLSDFQDYLQGVVTVYDENPYWWLKDDAGMSTKILNAKYFYQDKPVANIKAPLELMFTATWVEPERINGKVELPGEYKEADLIKYIAFHRVEVKQGGALIVDFYNVGDDLDMVLTYNRKSRPRDFDTSYISVPKGTSTHFFLFPVDLINFGDSWFYIGSLPSARNFKSRSGANTTINYDVSFVTIVCSYWSNAFQEWISSDCQTGSMTNKKRVHCFCTHHSSYGGSYLNSPNKLDPYKEDTLILPLSISWVVFIVLATVCLLYCIILACLITEPLHDSRKALFLTDNVESDNYYYLIVVKTRTGTTSNIGFQIYGSVANSRAHLLNYPDPYKKLLQRNNEDRFVMATSKNLGDVKHVWLWFDSVGTRPSWFCDWITVIDLQNGNKWHFDVNALFSVLEGGYCKVAVEPTPKQRRKTWKTVLEKHSWNFATIRNGPLSYTVRLTVIFSTVLTICSVALIVYHITKFRKSDGLGYGHYEIFLIVLFATLLSSAVAFGLHVLILERFNSNRNKLQNRMTWHILILAIIFNLTILVGCGFSMPYVDSMLWLTSVFAALVLTVLVFETIYTAFIKKYRQEELIVNSEAVLAQTENQKSMLSEHLGKELLRPMFINKYRSLTVEEWKTKKEKEKWRQRLASLAQDLIMFIIYIVLLFFIVLGNRDAYNVYSNKEITEMVVTENFEGMATVDESVHELKCDPVYLTKISYSLKEYLNDTLVNAMHAINWYGSWNTLQPGLLSDHSTKILGVARIRQQRVCKNCCKVSELFDEFNLTCQPEYSSSASSESEYMEFWEPIEYVAVPRLAGAWKYTYDAMNVYGYFKIYPAGGYSAPLGRTIYNSHYNLQYYFDTNWIDPSTRALFVEFLAYNVDYNMFHVVTLIVEKSATGLLYTTYNVMSIRFLLLARTLAFMLVIQVLIFMVIVTIMLIKNAYFIRTLKKNYVKDVWNIVDAFIVFMSFTAVGLYWYRGRSVGKFLENLEQAKHNHFLDYFDLIRIEYFIMVIAALLICVSTVRLWKLLRFIPDFQVLEQTIMRSGRLLLGLAVCHWIIWCMYTIWGVIYFGAQLRQFHKARYTLTTLMLLSMGAFSDFSFEDFIHVGGGYAYFYFITYAIVMLTIYTFYVSLLMICYSEANSELSNANEYYSVCKYFSDEFGYYKESFWRRVCRLRAGEDTIMVKPKVSPKADSIRYANSVTLTPEQVLSMLLVCKSVTENASSNQDPNLFPNVATLFYYLDQGKRKSEYGNALIGYREPDDEGEFNVVFEKRLLDIEHIVRKILEMGVKENSEFKAFEKDVKIEIYQEESDTIIEKSIVNQLDDVLDALILISEVVEHINVSCDQSCKRCNEGFNCTLGKM